MKCKQNISSYLYPAHDPGIVDVDYSEGGGYGGNHWTGEEIPTDAGRDKAESLI